MAADDFEEPQGEIEQAIAALAAAPEDPDYSARRAVIASLATCPVILMLAEPWDGTSRPEAGPRPMLVSDGPNKEQPMLAVFTRLERARDFQSNHGGAEYPSEVPGPWAILATPEKAGIMINPNQPLGFRASPEVIEVLRSDVSDAIERARARAQQEGS